MYLHFLAFANTKMPQVIWKLTSSMTFTRLYMADTIADNGLVVQGSMASAAMELT